MSRVAQRHPLHVQATYEIVNGELRAEDSVEAWLALGCEFVPASQGRELFDLGVPCRRTMTRPAEKRRVFVDADPSEAVWGSDPGGVDEDPGANAETEEREVAPAQYSYEAPAVLALLPPEMARWAYGRFTAAEFDAMYRLRDDTTSWVLYVEELRAGMDKR